MSNKYNIIYFANLAYELGKWAFVIILIGTFCHYFVATVFIISGPSMESNFHDGQVVLVSRIGLFTGAYQRGDPMVLKFPGDPEKKKYIKRLIALPGEFIEVKNNDTFIDNKLLPEPYIKPVATQYLPYYYEDPAWEEEAITLHQKGKVLVKPDVSDKLVDNEYFLMGDNRENSNDSRKWYPAGKQDMIGPVRFILGQVIMKPDDCVTSFCWPKISFNGWGPVVNPYYGN